MSIRSVMAVATLAGWLLAGTALAEPEATPGTGSSAEPGVWQEHQVELAYMGFTSHYSCDGLQSKLQLLLRQLGARGCQSQRLRLRSRFWHAEPISARHDEVRHLATGRRRQCRGGSDSGHHRAGGVARGAIGAASPLQSGGWRLRAHGAISRPGAAAVRDAGSAAQVDLRSARGYRALQPADAGIRAAAGTGIKVGFPTAARISHASAARTAAGSSSGRRCAGRVTRPHRSNSQAQHRCGCRSPPRRSHH